MRTHIRLAAWALSRRCLMIPLAAVLLGGPSSADQKNAVGIAVNIDLSGKPVTFLPDEAFGRAIDGLDQGQVKSTYTPLNINKINSSGFHRVSYRLRTELGIEAWHWSPEGTWSDPAHQQGYWVSNDNPQRPILLSYGYKLPRRGNTIDQANDNGYSRLDDGRLSTFWKSNPYLDSYFADSEASGVPQWIIVDFERKKAIDAVHIQWAEPYATRFEVQYWDGPDRDLESISEGDWVTQGRWHAFPAGQISGGNGGENAIRLGPSPIQTRFVRVLLIESSHTAPAGSTDIRDRLGFAVSEIHVGLMTADGTINDLIKHGARRDRQTTIYTSSTDPWHRATDLDLETEQPGIDRVFQSGMTNGLPVMMPVGVLYDTPDNAASEIRFLKARGYPVNQIELGEEPDGQLVTPEHYGDLFLQFAAAIHAVDPNLRLGAASFQSGLINTWPDNSDNTSWLNRFVKYLERRQHLSDWGFFSFERYPFDNLCQPPSGQLKAESRSMDELFSRLRKDGVPETIPWEITEYGYSAFAGRTVVEIPSALLNADMVAHFLMLGGKATYLYGSEPQMPMNELNACAGFGNMMLFEADDNGRARWPMPTYYGAKLMAEEWAQPVNEPHRLYPAVSDVRDEDGNASVTAFAVHRPDGKWSLMLINKDPATAYSVTVGFSDKASGVRANLTGTLNVFQYGPEQYRWVSRGDEGHPDRDDPPHQAFQDASQPVYLPPLSLTIVRGAGPIPP